MNKKIHNITLFVVVLGAVCGIRAESYENLTMVPNVWIGGNGDWTVDANWSLGHIPLATENIEIVSSSANVTISGSDTAVCQSLLLREGILTISSTAALVIDLQFNSIIGIENDSGRINNEGLIEIFDGAGTNAGGIKNTNKGLTINSGSILIHDLIGNNADGFVNEKESIFDNLGSLAIGKISGPGSDGVSNNAIFNNTASMNIDTVLSGSGILNLENGMFQSSGSISITEIEKIGIETEGGIFTNKGGALLSLTGIKESGIIIRSNSSLVNDIFGLIRIATGNNEDHIEVELNGIFDCQGELDVIVN